MVEWKVISKTEKPPLLEAVVGDKRVTLKEARRTVSLTKYEKQSTKRLRQPSWWRPLTSLRMPNLESAKEYAEQWLKAREKQE